MLAGQLALVVAAVFSGAAVYINAVEQPARLEIDDDRSLIVEWKVAYKRATVLQAPQTVVGFLLGLVSWWQSGHPGWLIGGLLMLAIAAVTFVVIFPTNTKLMATAPETAGPDARRLIEHWARLHAIRTGLGFGAILAFLWASVA